MHLNLKIIKMNKFLTFVLLIGLFSFGNANVYGGGNDSNTHSGKASWYGKDFHGGPTANGETYDMNSLTAAHKTLPFGTKVKVTNMKNGKSVVVRINNRGPFIKGRHLDLSRAAFESISNLNAGVINIKYEIIS